MLVNVMYNAQSNFQPEPTATLAQDLHALAPRTLTVGTLLFLRSNKSRRKDAVLVFGCVNE